MIPLHLTRRGFLFAGGGSLLAAAGCKLQRAALPERTFVLQAPRVEASEGHAAGGVLLIRQFRVAPAFESRAFVIRRGESEFVTDAYHAFLLSPAAMLTELFASWVRNLGVFATVTTGGTQIPPTHALEGEVQELYGDYRDTAQAAGVLGVQMRLLHPLGGAATSVIWQRTVRRAVALPHADATSLVEGWNQAVAEICREFEPLLSQRIPERRSPQA